MKLVFSKIVLSVVSLDNSGKHCLVSPFNFSTMHWFKNQARFSRVFHYFFSLKGTLLTDIKLKSVWTPLLLQKSSDTLSSSNIISITGLFSFQIIFLSWLLSIHWSKQYLWMCCQKIGFYEHTSKKTLRILFIWHDIYCCWKLSTEYMVIF